MENNLFGAINVSNLSSLTTETINRLYTQNELVGHHHAILPFLSQQGIKLYPSTEESVIQSRDITTPIVAFEMDNKAYGINNEDLTPEMAFNLYVDANLNTAGKFEKDDSKFDHAKINACLNKIHDPATSDIDCGIYEWRISMAKFDLKLVKRMENDKKLPDDTVLDKRYLESTIIDNYAYRMEHNVEATRAHLNNIHKFFQRHVEPLAREKDIKLIKPVKIVAKRAISWE